MRNKVVCLLLTSLTLFVFSLKGSLPDTICIHPQDSVAHLEDDHLNPSIDEIHIKLLPDIPPKFEKVSADLEIKMGRFFFIVKERNLSRVRIRKSIDVSSRSDPLRSVRLLI